MSSKEAIISALQQLIEEVESGEICKYSTITVENETIPVVDESTGTIRHAASGVRTLTITYMPRATP